MSLWEAQMLRAKGRLVLDRPFPKWLREASGSEVVIVLPLDVAVVVALAARDRAIEASGMTALCQGSGRWRRRGHPSRLRR